MYKIFRLLTVFIFITFSICTPLLADSRSENIELFIVFDKSKSMVEEIRDVTDYINETFIDNFLINGDRLVLIQFYGKADLIYDKVITSTEKKRIAEDLNRINADGRFTDIGNALDSLNKRVGGSSSNLRRYLILLTDGKQEAPPESRYYSPDGSFNHFFLENTKIIQKAGWKVIILGIGAETAVEQLADELGTTHEVLDFTEGKPLSRTPSEIIGRINASGFLISGDRLTFVLESDGYDEERTVLIEEITFQTASGNFPMIDRPQSIEIPPGERADASIQLSPALLQKIEGGPGTVLFKFGGDTPFLPAVFEASVQGADYVSAISGEDKPDKIEENSQNIRNNDINWLIIIIVIIAAAAVVAVILIRNLVLHRDEDDRNGKKSDEISRNS